MATVHIQPGTGTGSGTLADPYYYDQLSTAETAAGSGGTILFTDGDYPISTTTVLDGVGSSGNNITYKSLNSKGAVIKSSSAGTLRQITVGSTGNTSNINIENFKFIDCKIRVDTAGDGSVKGNEITTSTGVNIGSFLMATSSTGNSKFQNNLMIITRNYGNYVERDTGNFAEFSGNTIYLECGTGSFYFCYAQANSFAFCTVSKNNILYADDGSVIDTENNSMALNMSNTCFYQWDSSRNTSGGTNNIFADPLFVDPANRDFRLRPGSPCINDSEPSLQDLYPNAIWVSGGYSGTQAGTYSQPYDDLRTAVDSTASSDIVICVKAGTTSLVGGNYTPQQHTSVTIIGENGTTIDSGGATGFAAFYNATGTYTFKNIDFLNNTTSLGGHDRGFVGNHFDHLVLEECTYKSADNSAQRGVFFAKKITAKNCMFESWVWKVYTDVHVLNHSLNGLTAENCTFYNKKNNFAGSISGSADQAKVLKVATISNTATYTNCIFYAQGMSNTTTGLTGNNFTAKTFTDCCVYSPDSFLDDFTASQDSGTPVLSDPLFVDRANGDFRLRPGSPCITI